MKKNIGYVDDTSGLASSKLPGEEGISELALKLQKSGQIWNNLQDLTGHGLAYHKEHWRFLAWACLNGNMEMICSTKERTLRGIIMGAETCCTRSGQHGISKYKSIGQVRSRAISQGTETSSASRHELKVRCRSREGKEKNTYGHIQITLRHTINAIGTWAHKRQATRCIHR